MFLCSVFMLFLEGVSLQEEATFKKTSWRGVGGEGVVVVLVGWKGCGCKRRQPLKKQAGGGLPPQMHWMSLHRLAARGGNLNVFLCSVFRVWLQEEAT